MVVESKRKRKKFLDKRRRNNVLVVSPKNGEKALKTTVKELAEKLGVEYPTAAAIIKLMMKQGVCKEVEKRASETGKGKPSSVYEVPAEFTIKLAAVSHSTQRDKEVPFLLKV